MTKKVKVKEADLYSTFIEVPYTQGAQVRITQCYLQITPYLPLPQVISDIVHDWCITMQPAVCVAPCGLRGRKNRPAAFAGLISYKATKPISVYYWLNTVFHCCCLLRPLFVYC